MQLPTARSFRTFPGTEIVEEKRARIGDGCVCATRSDEGNIIIRAAEPREVKENREKEAGRGEEAKRRKREPNWLIVKTESVWAATILAEGSWPCTVPSGFGRRLGAIHAHVLIVRDGRADQSLIDATVLTFEVRTEHSRASIPDRRIDGRVRIAREIAVWEVVCNAADARIDWQFTTVDARIKQKRLDLPFDA
jgi:hypothetical protein